MFPYLKSGLSARIKTQHICGLAKVKRFAQRELYSQVIRAHILLILAVVGGIL